MPEDDHWLGGPDVLVGEAGARVAVGEDVTGDPVVGQLDRRDGRAVVDLVHPGRGDVERPGGDVGRGRRGGVEGVVGGVGPESEMPGRSPAWPVPTFLLAKLALVLLSVKTSPADAVVGQVDRSDGRAVVDLVARRWR